MRSKNSQGTPTTRLEVGKMYKKDGKTYFQTIVIVGYEYKDPPDEEIETEKSP